MTVWIIIGFLVLALATTVDWGDLFFDPDRDGEKRPQADAAEVPPVESRKPAAQRGQIHYTPITNQAFEVISDVEWKNTKAPQEKPDVRMTLELTDAEIVAMHEYNAGAAKKARIKLNEADFQKLKGSFLLGLSAEKTHAIHTEINLRLIKGYLAVYNQVHHPRKAKQRGTENPSPRTQSHPSRTAKSAKNKIINN